MYITRFLILFSALCSLLSGYTLHRTTIDSLDKQHVIEQVLEIQKSWKVDLRKIPSKESFESGFLFVSMKDEELIALLETKDAEILWIDDEDKLAGYLILTQISEFFDLYKGSMIRSFSFTGDLDSFEQNLQMMRYVEQIAVRKECSGKGYGSLLLANAKDISPNGLIAAILTKPFPNNASKALFLKNDFKCVGTLDCIENPLWPEYQTAVYLYETVEGYP